MSVPPPESVREHLSEILGSGDYQIELPGSAPDMPMPALPGFAFPVFQILLWLGVALIVVVIAVWIVNTFVRRRAPAGDEPAAATGAVMTAAPLGDAEALAREGRFDEAVHVLLLRTIEALRASLSYAPAPALTSREIRERAPISPEARRALGDLVADVEVSRFGGRPVGADAYRRCVERFKTFLELAREPAA